MASLKENQDMCRIVRDDVMRGMERKLTSAYNTTSQTDFEILVAECKANAQWIVDQLAKMKSE